jgi:hypothetical protein
VENLNWTQADKALLSSDEDVATMHQRPPAIALAKGAWSVEFTLLLLKAAILMLSILIALF